MTEQPAHELDLEFDLADRMRRALRVSHVGVQDMAEYLGVARNTVGTWINGHIQPSTQTIRLWALRTGVPFEWLQTGKVSAAPIRPGGISNGYLPRRRRHLSVIRHRPRIHAFQAVGA